MVMNIELKPCPFCGGEAEMMGDQYPYAECQECAAGFTANHSYEFDHADAASKWNARAQGGQEVEGYRVELVEKINAVSRRSLDGSVVMSGGEWNGIVELVEKLLTAAPTPEAGQTGGEVARVVATGGTHNKWVNLEWISADSLERGDKLYTHPAVPEGYVLMPESLPNEVVKAFALATVGDWDNRSEDQIVEVAEKLQHAFDAMVAASQPPKEVD